MGGRSSKAKGAAGELEVAKIFQVAGWPTCRRSGVAGQLGGDLVNCEPYVVEVKRRESQNIAAALRQVEAVTPDDLYSLVVHRTSRQPWLATLRLADFFEIAPGEKARSRRPGPLDR